MLLKIKNKWCFEIEDKNKWSLIIYSCEDIKKKAFRMIAIPFTNGNRIDRLNAEIFESGIGFRYSYGIKFGDPGYNIIIEQGSIKEIICI